MEMLINREFPKRPEKNKLDELKTIGSATISAELKHLAGIEDSFMLGPKTCNPGQSIAGPAITLQFMPIREDYYKDEAEYQNVEEQNSIGMLCTLQRLEISLLLTLGMISEAEYSGR